MFERTKAAYSMIAKSVAIALSLLCVAASCPAIALSQDIGEISCDVVSDYFATSPSYREVFQAYLEGYLAGQTKAGQRAPDENVSTLLNKIVEFCHSSRDATFAAAVTASMYK